MKFIKIDPKNHNGFRNYKKTKNEVIIDEFLATGYEVAMIDKETSGYSDVYSITTSLNASAKRFHKNIIVRCINKEAYIFNLNLYNEGGNKDGDTKDN